MHGYILRFYFEFGSYLIYSSINTVTVKIILQIVDSTIFGVTMSLSLTLSVFLIAGE